MPSTTTITPEAEAEKMLADMEHDQFRNLRSASALHGDPFPSTRVLSADLLALLRELVERRAFCARVVAMLEPDKVPSKCPMPDEPGFREYIGRDIDQFNDEWDALLAEGRRLTAPPAEEKPRGEKT